MTKDIIVARGKGEDLSWLSSIGDFEQFVYTPFDCPDIGREAGVYLHHIIKNYDGLGDINVFAQGNPLVHSSHFIERVRKIEDLMAGNVGFIELGDWHIEFDQTGRPHHHGLPIKEVWEKLFNDKCPVRMSCKAAGIFAVKGERIRKRDIKFYEKVYKLIDYEPLAIECYCLERLWWKIFE